MFTERKFLISVIGQTEESICNLWHTGDWLYASINILPKHLLPVSTFRNGDAMAAQRKRDVQLNFRVSPHELELIQTRMSQLGTKNREAYLRKMAIDGLIVNLEIPELKELLSLMRYAGNNLNQLTRRVHETGRIYDADLEDILQKQDALLDGVKEILTQLGTLA